MRKISLLLFLPLFLMGCYPSSISFVDGSMPEEWKTFAVSTLESAAPNTPLNFSANLTEEVKDGILNRTGLKLKNSDEATEVLIEGKIVKYTLSPVAIQSDEIAAQNRLAVTVNFDIFISAPEEKEMKLSSTRFVDYDATLDFGAIENDLLTEINEQIVQDVLNKLLSNW